MLQTRRAHKTTEQVDCEQEARFPQRKASREIRSTACIQPRKLRDTTESKDISVQLKTAERPSGFAENSLDTAQITETCHLNARDHLCLRVSEITRSIILPCTYFYGMQRKFIKTSKNGALESKNNIKLSE